MERYGERHWQGVEYNTFWTILTLYKSIPSVTLHLAVMFY